MNACKVVVFDRKAHLTSDLSNPVPDLSKYVYFWVLIMENVVFKKKTIQNNAKNAFNCEVIPSFT